MKYLRSFGLFWWNFIVGDDWRVAAGLAVALGLTSLLTKRFILVVQRLVPAGAKDRLA